MKIIGKAGRGGLILTATEREIEELQGLYSGQGPRLEVGMTISVNAMYNQVRRLREHRKEMEQTQKMLRMIADNIEVLTPIVAPEDPEEEG